MEKQNEQPRRDAILRPASVQSELSVGQATVQLVASSTLTASAEVIPGQELTSYGFPMTRRFTITEGNNSGILQYEMTENGEVVWHGLGTDLSRVSSRSSSIRRRGQSGTSGSCLALVL